MASQGWLCRRVACGTRNPPTTQKCVCGAKRPKKRVPAHRKALRDVTYEQYLELNGSIHGRNEECALCLRPPRTRRLDRDHDHGTGRPRGLLCARCNQRLERGADTEEWLEAALRYVRRVNSYYTLQLAVEAQHEGRVA